MIKVKTFHYCFPLLLLLLLLLLLFSLPEIAASVSSMEATLQRPWIKTDDDMETAVKLVD
jgi:hypothetical protein